MTCKEQGCDGKVHAQELCQRHYRQMRRGAAFNKPGTKKRFRAKDLEHDRDHAVGRDHDLQRRLREDFMRRQRERAAGTVS